MKRPSSPHRPASLRRYFLWLLMGVIGLFVGGMALSVVFSLRANEAAEMRLLGVAATQTQASVTRDWNYYREVIDNLARDPELIDLMLVGADEDKQQWAASRQRLLPGILGLALMSPQGEIYGDAAALRVGPACQRDLRQPQTGALSRVLVHRDQPGLEHADLLTEVRGTGGETLGKLFVSIRLEQLQRILDDSTGPGDSTRLLDAEGETLVSSGSVTGDLHEVRLPVQATGWTLVQQSPIRYGGFGGWLQILAGLLTLSGVLGLLIVTAFQMRRPVMQDIMAAQDALTCLTRDESFPPIVTRYVEFVPVAENINRIALHLQAQRERLEHLSLTDPLTGLPNRRAFEVYFSQALGLAERQHAVALVMIDVDSFKTVNDRYGHGVGDQVLLALAQSLKALTRRADLAARLAGDEFTVLLSDLDAAGVDAWYQRLDDHFKAGLGAIGLDLQTGLSAGQTWLGTSAVDSKNAALIRADRALYQAKARGRDQLVQYATLGPDTPE
ncbi:MAG: diguanylate cyclase [Hydrogenophilales bacterium RIFOXYD1_FULL_62_11]|nr:MAG: diguanylate cyclase [Hydrogenophilales bacterium RIFOXYD1_FULL_62_11]